MNLINDGVLDQNQGLLGFYSDNTGIRVSGNSIPMLFDTEIAVVHGLFLDVPINIKNNTNFVLGNVFTPKTESEVFLRFLEDAFYVGEGDDTLVEGYVATRGTGSFLFPIGDDQRLRPLGISPQNPENEAKCAYFFENPDAPETLGERFDISLKENDAMGISQWEFWRLEGENPTQVTLTWDPWSNLEELASDLNRVKVVGWSKEQGQWIDLGNSQIAGNMDRGQITSQEIIPDTYEVLTLGGNLAPIDDLSTIRLDDYYLSPNGDGINDYLVFEGIADWGQNELRIFDRNGVVVYSKSNYDNRFNGLANSGFYFNKDAGLPSGVYYYVITLLDLGQKHQGFLYITPR
ncbi:MAG: gliding motility-associated C-terminal domain-containing protein [Bacteroidota bacterium]